MRKSFAFLSFFHPAPFVLKVFPSSGGVLNIQSNGKCVYSSQPPVNPRPVGAAAASPPGVYTMSHAEKVACDVTDPDGNHFQVSGHVCSFIFQNFVYTSGQRWEDVPVSGQVSCRKTFRFCVSACVAGDGGRPGVGEDHRFSCENGETKWGRRVAGGKKRPGTFSQVGISASQHTGAVLSGLATSFF